MNILKALNNGYDLLKSSNINSYKIDTELLLSDSLNISREKLIINFKDKINMGSYRNFLFKLTILRLIFRLAGILTSDLADRISCIKSINQFISF